MSHRPASIDPRRAPRGALRLGALAAALLLGGCAAQQAHREGLALLAQGPSAQAVEQLRRASLLDPDSVRYRADYLEQRQQVVQALLARGDDARAAGRLEAAAPPYQEVARIEPGNERARAGLQALEAERRALQQLPGIERLAAANQPDAALDQLRQLLREVPQQPRALALRRELEERLAQQRQAREEQLVARAAFRRPVTLQLRDAPLRMALEALARAGGVNLLIDREVKGDQRTTIFVKDASLEDTLDVVLLQHQLEKRLLNSNSLLIYPATPARQKELAELKVRTFLLSNVDAAFMANILKTMLKTKDLVTDARTNTLVMRDTPEAIALAERLVAANDLPDAEVMLEVEVLEISSTRTSEIGLKLPTSFTLSTPAKAADGADMTLGALRGLGRNDLLATPLSATLNLMLQDSDTNILARPRIRTRHKEKAKVLVGDKLPVITNIIAPQQSGANSVLTGSIQYVDVGIKLEVEPQVHADGDVGIKLNLEVSNVSDVIVTQGGRAYQIGTRSAQTTLRLHDGETQILGGLISDDDRKVAQKVPLLGQLPVLGRLFSNHGDDGKKREIVLSITPHVVRPLAQPELRFADAWSGTESGVRDRPLRIDALSTLRTSAAGAAGAGTRPAAGVAPATAAATAAPGEAAPVAPWLAAPAAQSAQSAQAVQAVQAAPEAQAAQATQAIQAAPAAPAAEVMPAVPAGSGPTFPAAAAAAQAAAEAAEKRAAGGAAPLLAPVQAHPGPGLPGVPAVQARPVPGKPVQMAPAPAPVPEAGSGQP